ncbi:transposase [Stenotrophomonas sp. YIM B06876]|uniref:REP-associated tyrosine transposase n=1 Tax=Stenotrophomonas sp. YIM B06876 TaxID=3060211 RepID=UPI002738D963|nr:transposase [Stenotrophomonas sp. YIM B06876]
MASPRLLRGRVSHIGTLYSITTVTAGRRPLFRADGNARIVIDAMRRSDRNKLTCTLAWAVMPDHLHWLIQLRRGTLADCLRELKSHSAKHINQLNQARGSVWQAGYHDHAVRHHESLHALTAYILHNPVRAGLCTHPSGYPYVWCRWPDHANPP